MKARTIEDQDGDKVTVTHQYGDVKVKAFEAGWDTDSSHFVVHYFNREQSKAFRKALKRAERECFE